jgi:hypothetical protein
MNIKNICPFAGRDTIPIGAGNKKAALTGLCPADIIPVHVMLLEDYLVVILVLTHLPKKGDGRKTLFTRQPDEKTRHLL